MQAELDPQVTAATTSAMVAQICMWIAVAMNVGAMLLNLRFQRQAVRGCDRALEIMAIYRNKMTTLNSIMEIVNALYYKKNTHEANGTAPPTVAGYINSVTAMEMRLSGLLDELYEPKE